MTTKEFWDNYINKDILEIFDLTCDFFSKKLPQEFVKNYDVGEVILETSGHQETAKNFNNVLVFNEILQNKHPKLYREYFQYFDDFLVDYFCFQEDNLKVTHAFSNFIDNPLQDYDKYLIVFKKLLFYQHSELLEQAISKNFHIINESDDLIGNAGYELLICKFYQALEDSYKTNKENFDIKNFLTILSKFNFEFNEDFLSSIEKGFFKPNLDLDALRDFFIHDKKNCIIVIHGYFLRHMSEKGFEFYLSGKIWNNLLIFWQENNKSINQTPDTFFKIQSSIFEKYLAGFQTDMFLDNKSEMIATLWGSVYIYEFLNKLCIITQTTFNDFIEVSKILKGKIIGQFTSDLWNSNFVHCWEKPDCISETEFSEENKIFKKSIAFKHHKFNTLRNEISDELSNIGELSDYIIKGGDEDEKISDKILLDDLFAPSNKDFENYDDPNVAYERRTENKVGRNEPCPCGSGKKYKKCCEKK